MPATNSPQAGTKQVVTTDGVEKGERGAHVNPSVPRDLQLKQQLRPEWVVNRELWDGLPSGLKEHFNTFIYTGVK